MIGYGLGALCIFVAFLYEVKLFFGRRKNKYQKETDMKKNPDIAILIPARNESKVIEELLISIERQTKKIPSKNVYVIVESELDKTVEIVKKHQMNYFVRQKLDLKTKGYALQWFLQQKIQENAPYDAFFVFDADNIVDKGFIKAMNKKL